MTSNDRATKTRNSMLWAAYGDALVVKEGQLAVEGLGPVKALDLEVSWSRRKDFAWQWVETDFGQTLLIKRHPEL